MIFKQRKKCAENIIPHIELNFHVCPRDILKKNILLPSQVIHALNKAANSLNNISNGQYELVLTRGYLFWGKWRRLREKLAKLIFCFLYFNNKSDAELLFGHNGHDDGLSVDVQLYDVGLKKEIHFLSWRNIMISQTDANKIIELNKTSINMIDMAMRTANFTAHTDPREKLQMHYRLNSIDNNLDLIPVINKI